MPTKSFGGYIKALNLLHGIDCINGVVPRSENNRFAFLGNHVRCVGQGIHAFVGPFDMVAQGPYCMVPVQAKGHCSVSPSRGEVGAGAVSEWCNGMR